MAVFTGYYRDNNGEQCGFLGNLRRQTPHPPPGTAEWREYRAKFWDGTEVSGAWSEVVRVTVEG